MNIFSILREKKDHLIKKLDLTDEQKEEVIAFFNRRPDLESKVDWNSKDLTYDFFQDFIKEADNQATRGNLKKKGIGTFVEGKDYFDISLDDKIDAFIPNSYEFQKFIQNKDYFETEAEWCIGYQKSDEYWEKYRKDLSKFIIFVNKETKAKVAFQLNLSTGSHEVSSISFEINFWNKKDKVLEASECLKGSEISDSWRGSTQKEDDVVEYVQKNFEYFWGKLQDNLVKDTYFLENFKKSQKYTYVKFLKGNEIKEYEVYICRFFGEKLAFTNPILLNADNYILNCSDYAFSNFKNSKTPINFYLPEDEMIRMSSYSSKLLSNIDKLFVGKKALFYSRIEPYETCINEIIFHPETNYKDCELILKNTNIKTLDLPDCFESLLNAAFNGNKLLEKVKLPAKLKEVPYNLFQDCPSLKEVILPEGLLRIKQGAFLGCGLQQIKTPQSLKRIDDLSFYCCKSLVELDLSDSIEGLKIGDGAFCNCIELKDVKLPITGEEFDLDDSVFKTCTSLETINLEKVKYIGYKTFAECTSLKHVKFNPNGVFICHDAFQDCENLDSETQAYLDNFFKMYDT